MEFQWSNSVPISKMEASIWKITNHQEEEDKGRRNIKADELLKSYKKTEPQIFG